MAPLVVRMHVVQTQAHGEHMVIYGVGEDGYPKTLHVRYHPACYIRAQPNEIEEELSADVKSVRDALRSKPGYLPGESREVAARRFTYFEPTGAFWEARFQSAEQLRAAASALSKEGFELFQSDLDPVVRFYAELNLDTHGVVEISKAALDKSREEPVAPSQLRGLPAAAIPNRAVVAYFDFEVYSANGTFPNSRQPEDAIFMVCTVFKRMNEPRPFLVTAHALGPPEAYPDALGRLRVRATEGLPAGAAPPLVKFVCHATEADLLRAWCAQTGAHNAAYLVAHNGMGFDLPYLFERAVGWSTAENKKGARASVYAARYGPRQRFERGHAAGAKQNPVSVFKLGRKATLKSMGESDEALELRVQASDTAAHGHTETADIPLRGVVHVDTLLYLRKYHAHLEQFNLDFVAKHFLGEAEGKDGVTPAQMFSAFREKDPDMLVKTLLYCYQVGGGGALPCCAAAAASGILTEAPRASVQDVNLMVRLDEKVAISVSLPTYGSVFCVPSAFIQTRGQTVRVVAQCARFCNNRASDRVLLEARPGGGDDGAASSYEGATVIEPKAGFYKDRIVATLDFASLYPSLMMAYFICPTVRLPADAPWEGSCVSECSTTHVGAGGATELEERDVQLVLSYTPAAVGERVRPVQPALPTILADLKAMRKAVKRDMEAAEAAGDGALERMLNAKQLAIKVSMNSMYGFLGAGSNHLARPELAALITQRGRQALHRVGRFLSEAYPDTVDVLYGDTDSVMLLLKDVDPVEQGGMAAAFALGKRYAAEATKLLADERAEEVSNVLQLSPCTGDPNVEVRARFTPLALEFEKCYWPYLLVAKKMYCAGKYEQPEKMKKVEVKGLQLARRTVAEVVRAGQQRALDCLMKRRDEAAAREETLRTARALLAGDDADPVPYEFSQKLAFAYKVAATPYRRAKGTAKVEVTFDGRWRPQTDSDWALLMGDAPPPPHADTLPCTHEAYRPWVLQDASGAAVGQVVISQPHAHVATRMEEEAKGQGPRPGDRVRYVFLSRAHSRAEGALLATQACYAYAPEDARRALAEDEPARPNVARYFEPFVSGVCSFMGVVDVDLRGALERLGAGAMAAGAKEAKQNEQLGAMLEDHRAQARGGQRSVRSFFGGGTGTWGAPAAKRLKV